MQPIVCVRHEEPDHLGVAEGVFREEGIPVEYVDAWKGDPMPTLEEVSGLIVLGGEMGVDQTDQFPFLNNERPLLADAVRRRVPVLGICLGGQLLAQALGGSVRPSPAREFRFFPIRPTAEGAHDAVVSGFDDGARVFQWHRDAFDLPPGARLLLTGDAVPNQAFRIGERAWGVQFHPEVNREEIEAWLDLTGPDLKDRWGKSAAEIRSEADQHLGSQERRAREMFRRFARLLRRG